MRGSNPAMESAGEEIHKPGMAWVLPTEPHAHELAAGDRAAPSPSPPRHGAGR